MAIARVFKNGWFERFARKERLDDSALRDAVRRTENGLVDADLGGGVIKQRVARSGQGKSGGYRTLILFRRGDRAIFAFGFAKSAQANIRGRTWRSCGMRRQRHWRGAPRNWTGWWRRER